MAHLPSRPDKPVRAIATCPAAAFVGQWRNAYLGAKEILGSSPSAESNPESIQVVTS